MLLIDISGFKGQSRVIIPGFTSCVECQLDMFAPRAAVPLCTLATIPRQPEHCIEWANLIAWEEEKPFAELDNDDPEHITWLYEKALTRAEEFNIPGVTYSLTQGVVKNIIPAIASTNAIIAASCCNEALKIVSGCGAYLSNYMMYSGNEGIYTYTFNHEKKLNCMVCKIPLTLYVDVEWTLQDLINHLVELERPDLAERPDNKFENPSLRTAEKTLYMPSIEKTRENLTKPLRELLGLRNADYNWHLSATEKNKKPMSFLLRFKRA